MIQVIRDGLCKVGWFFKHRRPFDRSIRRFVEKAQLTADNAYVHVVSGLADGKRSNTKGFGKGVGIGAGHFFRLSGAFQSRSDSLIFNASYEGGAVCFWAAMVGHGLSLMIDAEKLGEATGKFDDPLHPACVNDFAYQGQKNVSTRMMHGQEFDNMI